MVLSPNGTAIVTRLLFCQLSIFSNSPFCSNRSRETPRFSRSFHSTFSGAMTVAFFCRGRKSSNGTPTLTNCCWLSGCSRFWSRVRRLSTPCSTLFATTLYNPKRDGSLNCLRKFFIKFSKRPSLLLNFKKEVWLAETASEVLRLPLSLILETTESFPASCVFFNSVRSSKINT